MNNSYDNYKLDNGETGNFEEDISITVVGSDENISEFEKRFNELILDIAKECDVGIKS